MVYRPQDRIFTPAAPTAGVVSLTDLKAHLRLTGDDEESLVKTLGFTALAIAEAYTQRLFSTRQCTLQLSALPDGIEPIELPGGLPGALTSVFVDGVEVTGCTIIGHSPALLIPATNWPAVTGAGYPITITYTAGYATVPQDLQHALKLIVGDLFEQRTHSSEARLADVPISATYLMDRHRIRPL